MKATIIGFGEAGPMFGKTLLDAGNQVTAFDRLQDDSAEGPRQLEKTRERDIIPANTIVEAVTSAQLIISTVTASEAINAARQAAPGLASGCLWLDLNSVAPATKKQINDIVVATGADFVEGVAMDTVPAMGQKVPLLLCGNSADKTCQLLNDAGFNTRSLGSELGKASSTKMLRSIMIKGMEALFAESLEAAELCGVADEVMDSLDASYPELDWPDVAAYQLSRATRHAGRRASEMRESAALIKDLGFEPHMASAIAQKQQELADRELAMDYEQREAVPSVGDFFDAITRNNARSGKA